MKYLKLTKIAVVLALGSLLFAACKKIETAVPMGDAGQTLVKIIGGETPAHVTVTGIDFVNAPVQLLVFELRRDVPSEAELNKTMVVTIKDDTAAVKAAGAYLLFPTAWFTVQTDGVKTGGQGGTWTFTFKPGEFAKNIFVTIPNATVLDPSSLYGLGFTILTADGGAKISTQKSTVQIIGAKNAYDGIYSVVSGFVQRYSAPGVPTTGDVLNGPLGPANADIPLITTGAYTNVFGANTPSAVGVTWANNTGVGGIDGLRLRVDPATNLVYMESSGLATSNATLTNWAGHTNKYDPATKTFTLAFRWNPATTTREYEVVLKYKGPR